MRVLVDGDACPVLDIIVDMCEAYAIELYIISDTNHYLEFDYGYRIIVDKQRDSSDYALVNLIKEGDIVITHDYGLAGMSLARKARVIHPNGFEFTENNIDEFLFSRYVGNKVRNASKKKHYKGPSKRTIEDDENFMNTLQNIFENR